MSKREEREVINQLERTCALQTGHFKLVSGNHSDKYFHVRLALADKKAITKFARLLSKKFPRDDIDVVLGFKSEGSLLAEQVANHLGCDSAAGEVRDGQLFLTKKIPPSRNVLIVSDLVTTGKSLLTMLGKLRRAKAGNIVGVGVIIDRSTEAIDFGGPFRSLVKIEMTLWPENECPLCEESIPLVDLSSPDTNPIDFIHTLPPNLRPKLASFYNEALERIGKSSLRDKLVEALTPAREMPGKKFERVAVLGSHDVWPVMGDIAKRVSRLGFHAITSTYIYEKVSGDQNEFKPYDHESMNDFLRRFIHGCQYAIVTLAVQGGQLIEIAWLNDANKPTLGLVYSRQFHKFLGTCPYLLYNSKKDTIFCNGFQAMKNKEKIVGGWICDKNRDCPFARHDLTKMVLDYFTTSDTMFLIGCHSQDEFGYWIEKFLKLGGVLEIDRSFGPSKPRRQRS